MRVGSKHILFDLSSRLASKDTIDSVLRQREVGRAKDLSAPLYRDSLSFTFTHSFSATTLKRGEYSNSCHGRLLARNEFPVSTESETELEPKLVWVLRCQKMRLLLGNKMSAISKVSCYHSRI